MAKQIIYGDEARLKLKRGVDALANAVTTTLGPKGRNVGIERSWGTPQVVHDGVTVAREIELEDKFANMGVQLVKEAASKTNDVAGDGTTTATLLTQIIVEEGLRNISAGTNPMTLKKGLEKASEAVIQEIANTSKEISTKEEKAQVATISAQDEEIGKLIAEAMDKVGEDGVITVDESKGLNMELEYKEGMQLEKGYASPYFVTDPEKMVSDIDHPYILITDKRLTNLQDLLPMLESVVKVSKDIVIITEEIDDPVLAALVLNKLNGALNILVIKAPGFGDSRKEMMKDIAILTGATFISEELGRTLNSVTVADMGMADKVIATKDDTVVIGGKGDKKGVATRISTIKKEIEKAPSEFEHEKLSKRLAKLSSGVAVINVGAATETELKEKKLRVEDAVNATKAAVEEGIVIGGGMCLLTVREVIKKLKLDEKEQVGANILYVALEAPSKKIIENAGENSGRVLERVTRLNLEGKINNCGFDVKEMDYVDMIEKGIIDPAKVTRSALQNAVSVALMILTTECLVADKPLKERE